MGITLVLASILLFGILNLAPGGPFDARSPRAYSGPDYLDAQQADRLGQAVHERYLIWVSDVLHGSLGDRGRSRAVNR